MACVEFQFMVSRFALSVNRNPNKNWLNSTQNSKTFKLRILDCMLHKCKHCIINEIRTVTYISLNLHIKVKTVLEIIGQEADFTLKHSTTLYITQNRRIRKHCETLLSKSLVRNWNKSLTHSAFFYRWRRLRLQCIWTVPVMCPAWKTLTLNLFS